MTHCDERQSEMLIGNLSHIHLSEGGSSSFIAGVHSKILENNLDGTFNLNDITNGIRWASSYDPHSPKTKLLCLENTHNRCGGYVLTKEYTNDIYNLLNEYSLPQHLGYKIPIHLDGARLFNASVALNCDISELTENVDSINICFSKGLGCPIGSILIGSNQFIEKSKRYRKALGGAMRQSGVVASCCLGNIYFDIIIYVKYSTVLKNICNELICLSNVYILQYIM